ncbi:hypothetical protein BJA5080_08318 [Bradyrhizobium diazoefficiens SEMIA 5080]|uniref:Uncharacterized protein n=1 Tax=Bradyrhizobium diazoefficiens SEMIA 5080 TaxID=754504 RepID=A0A837CC41_9BRAD|nr:hypothetical protein BJA5080_08318 [Bradyrhizobium diazoefficiens SEMIA 5080]
MCERPYRPLRQIDGAAQLVNLANIRGYRREAGFSQRLKLASLRRDAFQGVRHCAAEHPDQRHKGRTDDDREDQSGKLEPSNILNEVILGSQQQDAAVVSFAKCELRQSEQVALSVLIADEALVVVAVMRPSNNGGHHSGIDLVDAGQLRLRRMRHRAFDKSRKFGMRDERAGLVEYHDRAILARPLRLDECTEGIELEIGCENARHLAPQRGADGDHRRVDAERQIGCRNIWPVRPQRLPVPGPLAAVVSVVPQVDFADLVALTVLKDTAHRQIASWRRTNQADRKFGARRRPQPVALVFAETAGAPHLQPCAIVEASIDAVHLRHFLQRRFEQGDGPAGLRPFIGIGYARTGRQHIHQRRDGIQFALQTAQRLGAGGVHECRRGFMCRRAQRAGLYGYQQPSERDDKRHHRQCDRGSEGEHAKPPRRFAQAIVFPENVQQ